MNKENIKKLIEDKLKPLDPILSLYYEKNDVLRIEVISNNFNKLNISKRIDLVIELLNDSVLTDLREYSILINPLTVNEKKENS